MSVALERKPVRLIAVACVIFLCLSYLGGMPDSSKTGVFVMGILTLIAGGAVVIGIIWHLFLRELPANQVIKPQTMMSPVARRRVAAVLTVFTAFIAIGAVWDESWHGKYGIPFGEDFLWRPHQLIYMGFGVILLMATYAMYNIMRNGKGTLQQRFRADPMLGLFVIAGIMLLYAVPTDPFWHGVYGEGLSALSIPHALIAVPNTLIGLISINLVFSNVAARKWDSILKFKLIDLIPVLVFAPLMLNFMLLLTTDWHALGNPGIVTIPTIAYARPEWTLMLLVALQGTWMGSMVVFATRRYGMASLTLAVSALLRFVLVIATSNPANTLYPWLITLPAMIGVDVAVWYFSRRGEQITWWKVAIASAILQSVLVLPFFNQMFIYPVISVGSLPVQIIAILVGALIGSWMGQLIGQYIGNENKASDAVTESDTVGAASGAPRPVFAWEIPAALVAGVLFIAFWISISPPPA
jgi:hypothetical protein